jgi:hypothetical protein
MYRYQCSESASVFRSVESVPYGYVFGPPGSAPESVVQRYRSEDPHPDPYQNVTVAEHCLQLMVPARPLADTLY